MDKNNLPEPWEDEVRSSRQGLAMKTKAISHAVRQAANCHFWLGVG
jgi:hypothetical protein